MYKGVLVYTERRIGNMKKFFPAWIICFVLAFVFNPKNVLASRENKSNTNVDSVSFADDDIL